MSTVTAPIAQYQSVQLQQAHPLLPAPLSADDSLPPSWKGGDQLSISPEARALLDAKMQEFGARHPGELNKEQHEEIKNAIDALDTTDALHEDELRVQQEAQHEGANSAQTDKDAPPPDGPPPKDGKGGKGGPPPGAGAAGTADTSDDIEDLEDEIEELEEEIQELEAKAANDEEAKEELKAKRAELLLLEAELAMIEQQQGAM